MYFININQEVNIYNFFSLELLFIKKCVLFFDLSGFVFEILNSRSTIKEIYIFFQFLSNMKILTIFKFVIRFHFF
jgi:hypothetical protein